MSLLIAPVMLLAMILMPAGAVQAGVATGAGMAHGATSAQRLASLTRTIATSPAKRAAPAHRAARAVPASGTPVRRACPPPKRGFSSCLALMRTNVRSHKGLFGPDATPSGYGPSDFQSAYDLPSATAGSGQTVAIVDAYDDPNAEADLATYRTQFGLPACTTVNGCFEKVNQNGQQGSYPLPDSGWATEESLDLDMVSAICPNCRILLVEANDNTNVNLYTAEDEAVTLGAKYVSNSWAGCEYSGQTSDDQYFNHRGVAITAAGGDWGYDNYQQGCTTPAYPASSQYVTSVGGTALTRDSSVPRGWTETTWSPDPGATGSGCSQYEAKPAWQTDPGCANRMTNDVSADADPYTGAAVYDSYSQGGWLQVGGTSEATPIIAATYALAGIPAPGTYPASYPYADPSALNDVTSGSDYDQSCTPAYFCTAGSGYDGPTGLGTPNGVAAFSSAFYGTVTGTVTDASTGKPLTGAAVSAGSTTVKTDSSGQYAVWVPVGAYTITAGAFGYATQSVPGVQVSQGQATTENFALTAAPEVALSGTVRDGSGHGWPLYATVSVPGDPVVAHTNPVTGRYKLLVPAQAAYTVSVSAAVPGYQPVHQQVTAGDGNQTRNFRLRVNRSACDAAGYGLTYTGATEGFSGTSAPRGWTVTSTSKHGWEFDSPGGVSNRTGGSGGFAIAYPGWWAAGENTVLTSPVTDLTADKSPLVRFDTFLQEGLLYQLFHARVELSLDGGQTWSRAWSAPTAVLGPEQEAIPLPRAAGKAQVRIRFVYDTHGYNGVYSFWQLDNVFLGNRACDLIPGGMVEGTVTDANTGHAVVDAAIGSATAPSQTAASGQAPRPGFYQLFVSSTGSQSLTATAPYYASASKTLDVAVNKVTTENFALAAGRLSVTPDGVSATERLGSRTPTTGRVTVTNTGTAPARVKLTAAPGGFTLAGQPAARLESAPATPGAPPRRVKGHYTLLPAHASKHADGTTAAAGGTAGASAPGSAWVTGTDYPTGIAGSAVATDPGTGLVYSAGGAAASGVGTAAAYAYDPYSRRWTRLPHMPSARQNAAAAFTGGKLYVIGGWDNAGAPKGQVQIYDPATRTWSLGAAEPVALAASAVAVLDGDIYLIGGCGASTCGSAAVQVYDPSAGAWSMAASYPEPIAYTGCGTIAGKIYCAGGSTGTLQGTTHGYAYDPAANAWSGIRSLPVDLWGMAYAASGGQLLVSGGVTLDGTALTNQGFTYAPGSGWSPLASSPDPVYQAGSSCGLYELGGYDVTGTPVAATQVLPGYNDCGSGSKVPWMTVTPASSTLEPGQSETITVSMSADAATVTQPGTYTAALALVNSTPYQVTGDPVSVTMTATPPPAWGEVTGTVTGLACNGKDVPVSGATVAVAGKTESWTLTTGPGGQYALWAAQSQSPLTVAASAADWQARATQATVTAGKATTANLTLTPAGGCSAGARHV